MLRLLSRIDKHQVINPAVVMPLDSDVKLELTDVGPVRNFILYDKPMKHGSKFARVLVSPVGPNPDVNMKLDLSAYVAFIGPEYGHMDRGHVLMILRIFIREVERLIREADSRF